MRERGARRGTGGVRESDAREVMQGEREVRRERSTRYARGVLQEEAEEVRERSIARGGARGMCRTKIFLGPSGCRTRRPERTWG